VLTGDSRASNKIQVKQGEIAPFYHLLQATLHTIRILAMRRACLGVFLALALGWAASSSPNRGSYDAKLMDRRRLGLVGNRELNLQPSDDRLGATIISAEAAAASKDGSSDLLTSVFNLAKTILGSGILSLPAAVAAFSDESNALWLATALLAAMGATSAYSFSSIGNACQQHQVGSFKDAWAASVNPKSGRGHGYAVYADDQVAQSFAMAL
jgi:hypothetical protein